VPAPERPPAPSRRTIEAVVFVGGVSSLGAEIAATRLLAPFFGDSTIIYANTIATVLVALSAGYWWGGRLADRGGSTRGLGLLVLVAAVLLAVVPFVSGPFLSASVDALDGLSAGAFIGSLLAVSVLIAIPVLFLGTLSPYALALALSAAGTVEDAGRASGRIFAIGTLGSLVGTFLASLLLVPFVGTQRTFLIFAGALALVGVLLLRAPRAAAVPAVILAALAIPVGLVKAQGTGKVIWEDETEYQYARVLQEPDGARRLELNEGQAIHSLYRPGTVLTGNYWDEPSVLPYAVLGRAPRSLAILGNAAGTVARAYGALQPATRVDAVELDGELLDVGRRYFGMRGPNLHTHAADARPWLRQSKRRFDAILVDAYRQPYIPFYLTTREFFRLARDHLTPGGVLMINVGHPEESSKLERVLTRTMRTSFRTVLRDPSQDVNTLLVGTNAPGAGGARLQQSLAQVPPPLVATAQATAARLAPGLPGGEVYTDDRAPVEWLVDLSLAQVAETGRR
jgi:spermidine synthase